ncbi:MAG: PepSY domain-containing protein [Hyphomicrobiales bacterium]
MSEKKKKKKKRWLWIHKWFSIVLTVFVVIWSLSGIFMNHRDWIRSWDVPRSALPKEYAMGNWNFGALNGGLRLNSTQMLVYGNEGCFLTDNSFSQFNDYNNGFGAGADGRKIYDIVRWGDQLFAATEFGLYYKPDLYSDWMYYGLPTKEERIVDLDLLNDKLLLATRSDIFTMTKQGNDYSVVKEELLPAKNLDGKVSLFRTFWMIHSGEIFGFAGKIFVDIMALLMIFFAISGLVMWIIPKRIRKKREDKEKKKKLSKRYKWHHKYHLKVGIWVVIFLMIITITGMFLRPPLLIPIASSRVSKIAGTHLDQPNPYFDIIRAVHFDKKRNKVLVGTIEGIYTVDTAFNDVPDLSKLQPPISVMGINVMEDSPSGHYLVGSFSGLFEWNPYDDVLLDYFSGAPPVINRGGPPIGKNAVSGVIQDSISGDFYIDYNDGVIGMTPRAAKSLTMPKELRENSRMSFWNLCLETHTARIFQPIVGKFYILIIPLFGLFTFLILLSGLILWLKRAFRRKRKVD